MPFVLTAAAQITCPHGAPMRIAGGQPALRIDGQPVLAEADLLAGRFVGCVNVGPGLTPCRGVARIAAGQSRRLRVGGQPVMLDAAMGMTDSVPPGPFVVAAAGQAKVSAA